MSNVEWNRCFQAYVKQIKITCTISQSAQYLYILQHLMILQAKVKAVIRQRNVQAHLEHHPLHIAQVPFNLVLPITQIKIRYSFNLKSIFLFFPWKCMLWYSSEALHLVAPNEYQ